MMISARGALLGLMCLLLTCLLLTNLVSLSFYATEYEHLNKRLAGCQLFAVASAVAEAAKNHDSLSSDEIEIKNLSIYEITSECEEALTEDNGLYLDATRAKIVVSRQSEGKIIVERMAQPRVDFEEFEINSIEVWLEDGQIKINGVRTK